MFFGLMNAAAYFVSLMHRVFSDYFNQFIVVFSDDILIYSSSRDEHAHHLRLTIQRLREHKLHAKLSKCEFWLKHVDFLGHIISRDGLAVNPQKIATIIE
jgi:Reverse transcriptase (RNA-dependent DNA polymerase)